MHSLSIAFCASKISFLPCLLNVRNSDRLQRTAYALPNYRSTSLPLNREFIQMPVIPDSPRINPVVKETFILSFESHEKKDPIRLGYMEYWFPLN